MTKLRKQRSLFAGVRTPGDKPSPLLVDLYPKMRGFHAPQKDRLRQPMPPRVTNRMKREQVND